MQTHLFGLLIFSAALCGCAGNPYRESYQPFSLSADQRGRITAPTQEPQLIPLDADAATTTARLVAQGYLPVGSVSFVGPRVSPADIIAQAKSVGAALIAVSSQYRDTVTRKIALTVPDDATTYNTGAANTYATGGSGPGRYIGRSGSHGTQTTYIPYSVDRYDQRAIFYVPAGRQVGDRIAGN
jgi:hypothetical protein